MPAFAFGTSHDIIPSKIVPCDTDCGWVDFIELAKNIIRFLIGLIIAGSVLVFAYAGFKYMTALGDENKIKSAHEMFRKLIWGLIVALIAWLLVDILLSALTGEGLDSWLRMIKADNSGL